MVFISILNANFFSFQNSLLFLLLSDLNDILNPRKRGTIKTEKQRRAGELILVKWEKEMVEKGWEKRTYSFKKSSEMWLKKEKGQTQISNFLTPSNQVNKPIQILHISHINPFPITPSSNPHV